MSEFDTGLAGHHHVEHDEVEFETDQLASCFGCAARNCNAISIFREELLQKRADSGVVVDDQEVGRIIARNVRIIRHCWFVLAPNSLTQCQTLQMVQPFSTAVRSVGTAATWARESGFIISIRNRSITSRSRGDVPASARAMRRDWGVARSKASMRPFSVGCNSRCRRSRGPGTWTM